MLSAYWISNKGKVFELKGKYHIWYVIKYPNRFGETKESIQKEYDTFDEKIGWEGKAREVIITRILQRGFVRIRENLNRWSIQIWKMTPRLNDFIWEWARSIKVMDKYADVTIHELKTNKLTRTSFNKLTEDIVRKHLNREENIEIVNSIEDFELFE